MTGWRAAHGSGKDNEKEEEKRGKSYEAYKKSFSVNT